MFLNLRIPNSPKILLPQKLRIKQPRKNQRIKQPRKKQECRSNREDKKSISSTTSSTTSSRPHAGSEIAASLLKMTPVNNNINANETSRHKYVKVSQALNEPVSEKGEESESNNVGKNKHFRNETQKPTLGNDDRNDDDRNDDRNDDYKNDDNDHNAEKMSITENEMKRGNKVGKNSVSNFSSLTATLITEKMEEMLKQMNLEAGNSSIIGNSTSDIKKEKESRTSMKKKEDDVRMKTKNRKEKKQEGLVNKKKEPGRRKGRKYNKKKKKKHGPRHEKEEERIE